MSSSGSHINSFEQTTEIYFSEVLAGKPETIRRRLVDAMESLGFHIIEEQPHIIGRRDAKGWGKWYGSADVLEYATTLTIRFRNVGENSSSVTFDYVIKHGWLNEGDKKIVVQEARTIAALSRVPAISKMCPVCGIDSTDDSKFCRSCGAPLTAESSELEVLRLMAETRSAKVSVISYTFTTLIGTFGLLITLILSVAGIIDAKTVLPLAAISTLTLLFSILTSFFAWNRLKRALDTPQPKQIKGQRQTTEIYTPPEPAALNQAVPFRSITEGTTNLLDPEVIKTDEREPVLVPQKRETNELE